MDLDRLERTLADVERLLGANAERFMEIEAMLSTHRLLLEQLYANAFLDCPGNFTPFMDGLLEKTRTKTTASMPMPTEERVERAVRVATHLTRFAESVRRRLNDGGACQ